MGRARRSLLACALAGFAPAAGCVSGPEPDPRPPLARAQDLDRTAPKAVPSVQPPPESLVAGRGPLPENTPPPDPTAAPLPINLATALQLAGARPLDVQIAGRQVAAAAAAFERARLLWVPNLLLGTDYFAHTGPQQNFAGEIPSSTRSTFMAGLGANVVFSFSDAVYGPLAARQELYARQARQQVALNDSAFQVAEAYFTAQQARAELAGALLAEKYAADLERRAAALTRGLAPPPEENRARVELARRRQAVTAARERWRTASADLARLLRLDPSAVVEPMEPPFLPVTVIDPTATVDTLIPVALTSRPELAQYQAFVRATLARLDQEKVRPLVPSLAVRGASTNPAGTLGYGVFGGGPGGSLKNFAGRFDIDMQLLWEFQSLGFGNQARVMERRAEYETATLELFRTQDRIAAEVVQSFAQVRSAAERVNEAEPALREAVELVAKSLEGLGQTRRVGDAVVLVVRPQEAVAAVQALAQANADFAAAVADYNRAQFRLYRALGHPARCLASAVPGADEPAPLAPPVGPPPANPAQPDPLPGIPPAKEQPAGTQVAPLPPAVPVPPPIDPERPAERSR